MTTTLRSVGRRGDSESSSRRGKTERHRHGHRDGDGGEDTTTNQHDHHATTKPSLSTTNNNSFTNNNNNGKKKSTTSASARLGHVRRDIARQLAQAENATRRRPGGRRDHHQQSLRTTTTTSNTSRNEVVVGAEWMDILNLHSPLGEYVCKRARDKQTLFLFNNLQNEENSSKAFAFAKNELSMLRKQFIEGSNGDTNEFTEPLVVALQFDIDAGGLLDQFERKRLKSIGKENGGGLQRSSGMNNVYNAARTARLEYVSHPSDKDKGDEIDDDENYLFDFASRRIKDAFYAHGGGCAVLENLKNSGNGAHIELPYPPFGMFPIKDDENYDDENDTNNNSSSSSSSSNTEDEDEKGTNAQEKTKDVQAAFAALGLETATQTAPERNTREETLKRRSRCVYIKNNGREDITLVAVRIVDANEINENGNDIINSNSRGENKDPWQRTRDCASSVFSLRDDYNISASRHHHRMTRRENSNNRKRPIVRIPAGGVYPVTVECTIDVETKRAYMASWIVAIFGTKKQELCACATQCSVLITCSNAFNNATNVSVLSEEATPFIPDSLRYAFDSEPVGYYPPGRSYLDIIWGHTGRYFLAIENRNVLPASADYYASRKPTWLSEYKIHRTMIMHPELEVFFESLDHAPWTKSLEWARVFREISSSSKKDRSFDNILLKSARLLFIEEAQQNNDVKRYDMFNRTLHQIGQSTSSRFVIYSLEVPGLQNGYPPIVVGDVVRCRVKVGNQEERDRYVEYGFRIVAIISKIQTVHLQAPWTVNAAIKMGNACTEKTLKVHVRFAMDENYFSRCRAALCACATLKVGYGDYNNSVSRIETGSKGQQKNEIERLRRGINEEQYQFVMRCRQKREQLSLEQINDNTNTDDIKERSCAPLVCFGPPGTGKTLTIAHAVLDALSVNPEARILVCAPAPYAADVILDRIVHEHPKYFSNSTPCTNVYCRIDDPRRAMSEKMDSITPFTVDVDDWFASEGEKNNQLQQSARVLVCSCVSAGILYEAMKTSLHKARANVNVEIDGPRYRHVNFAFHSFFEVSEWDELCQCWRNKPGLTHLFIDEAAQATIPEVLIPMSLANKQTLVVMSGDPKQLGPLVHSKVAMRGGLEKSLLEMCVGMIERRTMKSSNDEDHRGNDKSSDDENLITLTKNYRSHPDILAIPSESFYGEKLEACASEKNIRLPEDEMFERLNLMTMHQNNNNNNNNNNVKEVTNYHRHSQRHRNVFIAVEGLEKVEISKSQSKVETKSFSNALECEKVCEIISALMSASDANDPANRINPRDIEVIAVYRRQVLLLRQVLRRINLGAIRVGTIDDYQGQEAKVIIISTVASTGPSALRRRQNGEGGFGVEEARHTVLSDPKRFNVATSRAKALNVIVGHPKALRLFPNWSRLIRKISQNSGLPVGDMSTTNATRTKSSNKPPTPSENNTDINDMQFFIDEYASIEEDLEKEKTKMMSVFDDDDMPWRVQL